MATAFLHVYYFHDELQINWDLRNASASLKPYGKHFLNDILSLLLLATIELALVYFLSIVCQNF
jgi:hypothetical protein